VFLAPWSRSRSRLKKKPGAGAGAAWEKNQEPEPEPLEKKVRSRSRSRKKICRLPSPGLCSNIIGHSIVQNFQPVSEIISEIQSNPSPLGYGIFFFKWSWKISNLSKCSKIIEHCHLVQNFPPVPEMLSEIQSDASPLGYSVFFSSNGLRKYKIIVYVDKYFNFTRPFRIFPPDPEMLKQIQYNPFPLGYGIFSSKMV